MAVAGTVGACGVVPQLSQQGEAQTEGDVTVCPAVRDAPDPLPGVATAHRTAAYWIDRTTATGHDPDAVILSAAAIRDHNAAIEAEREGDPLGQVALSTPVNEAQLAHELSERLAFMHARVEDDSYRDGEGRVLDAAAKATFVKPNPVPELQPSMHVALEAIPLRCGPRQAGLYKGPPVNKDFDRNNCSTIRPQEPVRVLTTWPGGMKLVRARYALGWISAAAKLSPQVPQPLAAVVDHGDRYRLSGDMVLAGRGGARLPLTRGTFVPHTTSGAGLFATSSGFDETEPLSESDAVSSRRALTRRALYEEAFRYLDTPYGWGGQSSGRDCSRFLMDVFAAFGLRLPRSSGLQAQSGSMRIDLSTVESSARKLALIDEAAKRGVVLLHFPGHIMLYLGRNDAGAPMVLHAFAEYLESCSPDDARASGRDETLVKVSQIQVSDLTLGHDTKRTSFIERISGLTLFGETPGAALLGVTERRTAAPRNTVPTKANCADSSAVAVFVSPRRANVNAPLRIIVASERDLGPVAIRLGAPDGAQHQPRLRTVGGPPFTYWAELPQVSEGSWTAWIGDGQRVEACKQFRVHARGVGRQAGGGPVWQPQRRWDGPTENLFSGFVEQLFDYPPGQDLTWTVLSKLLENRDQNILFNHLDQREEGRLKLTPDCADLPYFLRAYFAWKLRLPFAYRHCNRGKPGRAPYCDRELHTCLTDRENSDETKAFSYFARRTIADGVHSGTGRTAPEDPHTDYYPVPLTRAALKPGTLFADPYGHLFIVADWVPQGIDSYGMLIGADAQPDGTVGRRRFWRGSFLFTPQTEEAGAGFKAFRPLIYKRGRIRALSNEAIANRPGATPFSLEQYELSKDGFYDRVEALINPRPLDPKAAQDALIAAFYEQVKRRVVSVQNAIDYKASHRSAVGMPHGHSIFETSGAWENYSTPSRDMRLLIAMDTVLGFPETVQRNPQRFGIASDQTADAVSALRQQLDAELPTKRFSYTRSDGSSFELNLQDVVDRAVDLQMAYNPNDCSEIRWAAPEGSDERVPCRMRAPSHQTKRMGTYRNWFATRTRPAR